MNIKPRMIMLNPKLFTVLIIAYLIVVNYANLSFVELKSLKNTTDFYKLPRFWTNTGFCPWGDPKNSLEISKSLLSKDVHMNLIYISSLPNNGLRSVRIHWLLQLIELKKFNKYGMPEYNFFKLDKFLKRINQEKLAIGFEFMGNPSEIFTKYKNLTKEIIWKDLSFQIIRRYIKCFGIDIVSKWKFETWNEPDLLNYNLLKFSKEDYIQYVIGLRKGLNAASRQFNNITNLNLYGPAGLFKKVSHHPLCWSVLKYCNAKIETGNICPFNVVTFHRKGQGVADNVFLTTKQLITDVFQRYPGIKKLKFSNNEADPIAGWSTPRLFQSDIHYALDILKIIFQHWNAIINLKEFQHLESISHDNAFLSYWPHVFNQRTLLARFQMNNTRPTYSAFIQKSVYCVLGLLGNLGEYAKDIQTFKENDQDNITALITSGHFGTMLYLAIILYNDKENLNSSILSVERILLEVKNQYLISSDETFSYIIEGLIANVNDPSAIWSYYNKPPFPNKTVLNAMRSVQNPILLKTGTLKSDIVKNDFIFKSPWILLLRVCSLKIDPPFKPKNLKIWNITSGEVLITWKEIFRHERCLMTYEIHFSTNFTKNEKKYWLNISTGVHVPFLSYHFQPKDGIIEGYYKVRGIDIFGRKGHFSNIKFFPLNSKN